MLGRLIASAPVTLTEGIFLIFFNSENGKTRVDCMLKGEVHELNKALEACRVLKRKAGN